MYKDPGGHNMLRTHNVLNLSKFFGDVSYVGLINILIFGLSVFQAVFIPKVLSIEGYGYWRLFILYITFSGLLHLGFVDGLYLCWAGKKMDELKSEFRSAFITLVLLLLFLVVPLLLIVIILPFRYKVILVFLVVYAFFFNINGFFQITLQAVKEFKVVSRFLALVSLIFCTGILALFFLAKISYHSCIIFFIIAHICVLIGYFLFFKDMILSLNNKRIHIDRSMMVKYIKIGWPLLLGNFLALFITNSDMISISLLFDMKSFAYYSFAIALLSILGLFTKTVATVFFPHLAGTSTETKVRIYQASSVIIITIWSFILGVYPLIALFINSFLSKYVCSLSYLKILFFALVFSTTIQILHVSYYQLHFEQKKYLILSLVIVLIALPAYFIASRFTVQLEIIAIIKVSVLFVWFVTNELLLRNRTKQAYGAIFRRIIAILAVSCIFIFTFYIHAQFMKILIFYIGCVTLLWLLFKRDYRSFINQKKTSDLVG
jgi:O-antigen/teichoic acid export membrane protein